MDMTLPQTQPRDYCSAAESARRAIGTRLAGAE